MIIRVFARPMGRGHVRLGVAAFLSLLAVVWSASHAAEDQFLDSHGVRIHYVVAGKGEPILLLHGFGDHCQGVTSDSLFKPLTRDYQVISFDCRGHGRSGKPHETRQYGKESIEDAIRLLDHLRIKKVHVIGYSMGGTMTLKLTVAYPGRVVSAISVASGGMQQGDTESLQLTERVAEDLEQGRGITRLAQALRPGRPKPTAAQMTAVNVIYNLTQDTKALACLVRAWSGFELPEEQLRANQVPVLAIIGEQDGLKHLVDHLQAKMAMLKVIVVKDADHGSLLRKPELLQNIKAFLTSHARERNTE